ncbi:hypothetical protein RclHR1_02780003 [Rhizophagus clarus]|uniref:Uncharacterized protein n=1 Tax=Rhizophagus clarus TaxID=94130 RepID=A0A2Z6R321_9GLOM|nr:hypothetical protein RclHR1_02780003 [Rhizophagus clarus]GES82211.1 hypothetical protein GLOIN_2v1782606 [Rhizophagus clarus]
MSESTVVGPGTYGMPYFIITTDLDPKKLASASTALLDAVEARPKLTKAFRLEVKLLQNSAEFRICLDTVAWYDCYLRTNSDLIKVIEIARKYVSITRSEIPPDEDGPFTIDYQESEKEMAYIRCTKKHEDQDSIAKCAFDHPKIVCNEEVTTRDGRKTTCNFYLPSKLIVQDLSTTNYVVLIRREPIRELLMLPCNHFNNETLVKNIDYWNELLNQWQRLTFHSIALNYGQWETKQSRDKYAQSCHAHVHLYFDKEAGMM